MSANKLAAPTRLVCGSGGSRAILASGGAIYALHRASFNDWTSVGGISGGSIPTALLASGYHPSDLLKMAVDVDFSSLLTRRTNLALMFLAFLLKERLAQTRPRKAVLGSELLGEFIDERCPTWPANYWTMAVAGRTQVLFTADGVYQYLQDGTCRQLDDEPAPMGLAVRASCAVPGIIDPVKYKDIYLFDGALSWDGQCPIGLVLRHYKTHARDIIACDVGDRESTAGGFVNAFWRIFCGNSCVWPADEPHPDIFVEQGSIVAYPAVNSFGSLQFKLSEEQKWDAVRSGFAATITELWKARLIDNAKMLSLAALAKDVDTFRTAASTR